MIHRQVEIAIVDIFSSIRSDGMLKALPEETTLEEVLRVMQDD